MRFVRDNVVTRPKNEDSSLAVFLELEYYLILLDSLFGCESSPISRNVRSSVR